MEVILAKTAGFCFGVKCAIDTTYKVLEKEKNVYSYGSLIHNEVVINELKEKGLKILNTKEDLKQIKNSSVIIRTHGVEKEVYEILKNNNCNVIDATCPFVKKIHKIVDENTKNGETCIVIGDLNHPEVKGIVSYASSEVFVINNIEDINKITVDKYKKIIVVSQTTMDVLLNKNIVDILNKIFYNIVVYNTVCNSTFERQKEVENLSNVCDMMFIIGSINSSNTKKLYNISKKNCEKTFLIQSRLDVENIKNIKGTIGISAGASTPYSLIEEIVCYARAKF